MLVLLLSWDGFCCWPENMLLNCENIPPKFIGNDMLDEDDDVVVDEVVKDEDEDEVEECDICPRSIF